MNNNNKLKMKMNNIDIKRIINISNLLIFNIIIHKK